MILVIVVMTHEAQEHHLVARFVSARKRLNWGAEPATPNGLRSFDFQRVPGHVTIAHSVESSDRPSFSYVSYHMDQISICICICSTDTDTEDRVIISNLSS